MNNRRVEEYISEQFKHDTFMAHVILWILAVPVLGVGYLGLKLGSRIEPSNWLFGPIALLCGTLGIAAGVIWYSNLEHDPELPEPLRGIVPSLVSAMVLSFTFAVITPALLVVIGNAVGSIVPGEDSTKVILANVILIVIFLALVVAVPWIGVPLLLILLMGISAS